FVFHFVELLHQHACNDFVAITCFQNGAELELRWPELPRVVLQYPMEELEEERLEYRNELPKGEHDEVLANVNRRELHKPSGIGCRACSRIRDAQCVAAVDTACK